MNRLSILLLSILFLVTAACKSAQDKNDSTKSNIDTPIEKVDQNASNNEVTSQDNTDVKSKSKTTLPTQGKKGKMKGGLPPKTIRFKDGMLNTVKAGKAISDLNKVLFRSYMDLGAGREMVYQLADDKGGSIGYIVPRIGNTDLVGDMTITSFKVLTKHGLRIGDTFKDLVSKTLDLGGLREFPTDRGGTVYVDGITYLFTERMPKADSKIVEIVIEDQK